MINSCIYFVGKKLLRSKSPLQSWCVVESLKVSFFSSQFVENRCKSFGSHTINSCMCLIRKVVAQFDSRKPSTLSMGTLLVRRAPNTEAGLLAR